MFSQFWCVARPIRIILSTNSRWDKVGPWGEILIGLQFLFITSCFICLERRSIQRINMYSEIGSPCRIYLEGLKKLILSPLTRTTISLVVTQDIMILIKFSGNPKNSKVSRIKDHNNLSKAFLRSILSNIRFFFLVYF